jgi:DNA-binding NtrC family response regulator
VRELRNAVARWLALGDLDEMSGEGSEALPYGGGYAAHAGADTIGHIVALDLPLAEARQKLVDAFERRYVEHVLDVHGGNVTRAAAAAGVARRHLQRIKARTDAGHGDDVDPASHDSGHD